MAAALIDASWNTTGEPKDVAKELAYCRRTYNSRSKTVNQSSSFRMAWKRGQRCITRVEKVYEPCYES